MRGNPVELLVRSKEKILEAAEDRVSSELKKELLAVLAGLATRVVADKQVLNRVLSEIEAMGENYVFDRYFNRGLKEGIEKGREEEAREAILRILRRRFGMTGPDVSPRLAAISSRSDLEALIDDAVVAATIEEFLSRIPS
jgi:AcrR family transcriptional regulator